MITSFEVGAVFRIGDMASPALIKLAEQLERLDLKLKGVQDKFAKLGSFKGAGVISALADVEKKLSVVGDKSLATADALTANFAKVDAAVDRSIGAVTRLTRALGEAKNASNGMGRLPGPGGGGAGGAGAGRTHNRPGMHNAAHAGLGLGITGFIGAEEVGHGLYDVIKQASELRHVQEQMAQGGMKQGEIAASLAESWKIAAKYGVDVAKVMGDIKELRAPFGKTDEAIHFIEPLERMRIVLDAVSEGKGTNARDAVYKMARAGELKGLVDADDYLKYFDAMTKVVSATGGKVGPNDFMQATKYARLSALGFNQEYYTKYLPTMIQALGASGAGTANAALFGTLIQGKASEGAGAAMDKLGLIGDRSKIRQTKMGIHLDPGAIVDSDLLMANPLEWVRKDLLGRMEAKYGDLSDSKNRGHAIEDLGQIFGNRMSAQAVGEMLLRMKSFDRDAKMIGEARGLNGVEDLQGKDPVVAAQKLVGAWDNLLKSLGGPLVDPAVAAMTAISGAMTKLTQWANEHPDAVKNIGAAAAGLAGGLAVLTAAGIVSAAALLGPGGAIAVAIATIGGAITGLAALHWDELANGLSRLWSTLKSWMPQFQPAHPSDGSDALGPMQQSYSGPELFGGSLIRASLNGGAANDNAKVLAGSITGGISNSNVVILGGAGAGGGFGGAGGGSFGGGGRAGGFIGGGSGSNSAFSNAGIEAVRQYIRTRAAALGIDPNIAERVARSEGLNSTLGAGGDGGTSDGPYQLHVGGGIGDLYQRLYHRSIHDKSPQAIKDQIDFALGWAAKHGWHDWHGAANSGIGDWQGIGREPVAVSRPPRRHEETHIHNIHIDGKVLAQAVTKRQTQRGRFPTAVGGMDTHSTFASPGTPQIDAA